MRVVITGGTGLIGRALCRSLAEDGHEVTVLSRSPERAGDLPAGVATAAWDARSVEALVGLFRGVHGVVHLAGENIAAGRWTTARKRRIRDSRMIAARNVVRVLLASA